MRNRIIKVFCLVVVLIIMTACAKTQQQFELDNRTQIVKTYWFEQDTDKIRKIPEYIKEGNCKYVRAEVVSTDVFDEDKQDISVEKEMFSTSRIFASDFDETIEYEEDGYTGSLIRDDGTFTITTETKNVNRTVTEAKNYSNLPRNDMSLIDKNYNGLSLFYVDWYSQNTGQSVSGFIDGIPGSYSATAHYKGVRISSETTGYNANITYAGSVVKKTLTGTESTVIYAEQPITKSFGIVAVLWLFGFSLLGTLATLFLFSLRKRKNQLNSGVKIK